MNKKMKRKKNTHIKTISNTVVPCSCLNKTINGQNSGWKTTIPVSQFGVWQHQNVDKTKQFQHIECTVPVLSSIDNESVAFFLKPFLYVCCVYFQSKCLFINMHIFRQRCFYIYSSEFTRCVRSFICSECSPTVD